MTKKINYSITSKKGKIFGFLQDIDKNEFYKNRYISLQEDEISSNILINEDLKLELDIENIEKYLNIYIEKLKEIE